MRPTVKTKMMNRFLSTDVMCKVRHNIYSSALIVLCSYLYLFHLFPFATIRRLHVQFDSCTVTLQFQ